MAYDRGKWLPLQGPLGLPCSWAPEGLSDADASGTFRAVGQLELPTVAPLVRGANNMLEALVGPTRVSLQTFGAFSESNLMGINAGGLAAGYTDYFPMSGWTSGVAAVILDGSPSVALLQPRCAPGTAGGKPCLSAPVSGARNVNAGGTILGTLTNAAGYVEVNAKTGAIASVVLPKYRGYNPSVPVGLDDASRIVYTQGTPTGFAVFRYDPKTRTTGPIGTIPGCPMQVAAWVNGPGDVFAQVSDCATYANNGYYLWRPSAGWAQMAFAAAPSGCAVYFGELYQMNDKDQFAVNMSCTGGVTHWTLLCPTTAPCGPAAPAVDARPVLVPPVRPGERSPRTDAFATAAGISGESDGPAPNARPSIGTPLAALVQQAGRFDATRSPNVTSYKCLGRK